MPTLQELHEAITRGEIYCEWFALCTHPATGTLRHPVLGLVPICDRCRDIVEANS